MYFMTVLIFPLVSIYLLQHSFWINFFVSSGKLRPSTTCLMPPTKPTIFSRSLSLTSAWKSCFLLSLPERPFQNFSALKPVYRRLGTKKSFLYLRILRRWKGEMFGQAASRTCLSWAYIFRHQLLRPLHYSESRRRWLLKYPPPPRK